MGCSQHPRTMYRYERAGTLESSGVTRQIPRSRSQASARDYMKNTGAAVVLRNLCDDIFCSFRRRFCVFDPDTVAAGTQ